MLSQRRLTISSFCLTFSISESGSESVLAWVNIGDGGPFGSNKGDPSSGKGSGCGEKCTFLRFLRFGLIGPMLEVEKVSLSLGAMASDVCWISERGMTNWW